MSKTWTEDDEKRYQALLEKYGIKASNGGAMVMQSDEDPKEAPESTTSTPRTHRTIEHESMKGVKIPDEPTKKKTVIKRRKRKVVEYSKQTGSGAKTKTTEYKATKEGDNATGTSKGRTHREVEYESMKGVNAKKETQRTPLITREGMRRVFDINLSAYREGLKKMGKK